MPARKEEPYCLECGCSYYIIADATAQWDDDTQRWELCDTGDASMCTECDGEWRKYTHWRKMDMTSGLVSKIENGQPMTWWSDDQIDAALCLWEYSNCCREAGDESVHDWLRGGEGAAAARQQCIALAKDCERSYTIALELGYDTSFDWEFAPRWVREAMHITTYSLLTPAWVDYIGRRIYDEFRLEH